MLIWVQNNSTQSDFDNSRIRELQERGDLSLKRRGRLPVRGSVSNKREDRMGQTFLAICMDRSTDTRNPGAPPTQQGTAEGKGGYSRGAHCRSEFHLGQ